MGAEPIKGLGNRTPMMIERRRTPAPEPASRLMHRPEVMDVRAAADYLGVSCDTLYKYLSEDRIPAFKLGNRWRFKKTVLDQWMESESRKGTTAKAEGH
ncbi:MAG TPA: helix-turn-helix domain-containing protein [Terriglobia bacterium]|nr:helix-turn-helix domain-containing protein [Terriglobia bacterium]